MSWLWGGSSSEDNASSSVETPSTPLDLSGGMSFGSLAPEHHTSASSPAPTPFASPVLALDQIKQAGVPVTRQMTPYLQMDPSIFVNSTPQYVMPDGGVTGKGKFEFALGHIGWGVGGGFAVGCARGGLGEMLNPETRKMVGAVVFLYSALEIGLRSVRADDDLNGLGAGAMTGALYRSPHGLKASGIGAGVGVALAAAWILINPDSRQRVSEIFA